MKTLYLKHHFLILILILFLSCKKDNPITYQEPVNNAFSLDLPYGWYLENGHGMDSYVGSYHNATTTIMFDYGRYSSGFDIKNHNKSSILYYEEVLIDGCNAQIVKEDRPDGIRLSAFIGKMDSLNGTWLCTLAPKNDEAIIKIYKSHKFK